MWNCPVCLEVPTNEIFQCSIGHSLCGSCKVHLERCPICREPISTIRNFLAEELLDKIILDCPWKDQGCLELITRQELPIHDELCKDGLLFSCSKTTNFTRCQFNCCIPRYNNDTAVTTLLEHMKNEHGCPVRKECSNDTFVTVSLNTKKLKQIAETHQINTLSHIFLQFPNTNMSNHGVSNQDTIMVVNKAHRINQTELVLSWTFVMLTSTDKISNFSVTMFYTNKDSTTSKSVTKPIRVSEFRQYLKIAKNYNENPYCQHSIVFGEGQDIPTNNEGLFMLGYTVQKVMSGT